MHLRLNQAPLFKTREFAGGRVGGGSVALIGDVERRRIREPDAEWVWAGGRRLRDDSVKSG